MAGELSELQNLLDNIKIQLFQHKHITNLNEMLDSHDYITKSVKLPKIGYIAMLGDQPVAAGFLRRTEGDVIAIIDGLTSNSAFGSIIRHKGLESVVTSLLNEAKHLKIQGVIAWTKDEGILKRAKSIGFKQIDENLISLTLAQL